MEKPKICVLTPSFPRFENGFPATFGGFWVQYLHKTLSHKYDFHFVVPYIEGTEKFESHDGLNIHHFDFFGNRGDVRQGKKSLFHEISKNPFSRSLLVLPFYFIAFYLAARRVIKREKIQLVHAHWTVPCGLVAIMLGKEFVCSANGSDIRLTYKIPVIRNIIKWILSKARVITTIGPETEERIVNLGIEPEKVFILHQAIDPLMFQNISGADEIRKKYQIEKSPAVLFIGNLEPIKSPDNVLRAVALAKTELPDIRLLVIGQGSMKAGLQQLVKKLGLDSNVTFIDPVPPDELLRFLKAGDLLAPTMKDTGIAAVQLEAAAMGTPFISSVPDYFKLLKAAVLEADVASYQDVASKIVYYFSHKEEVRERVSRYQQQILHDYSWENVAKQLESAYQITSLKQTVMTGGDMR